METRKVTWSGNNDRLRLQTTTDVPSIHDMMARAVAGTHQPGPDGLPACSLSRIAKVVAIHVSYLTAELMSEVHTPARQRGQLRSDAATCRRGGRCRCCCSKPKGARSTTSFALALPHASICWRPAAH